MLYTFIAQTLAPTLAQGTPEAGTAASAKSPPSIDASSLTDPNTLLEILRTYGPSVAKAVLLLLLTCIVAGLTKSLVNRACCKAKVETTLSLFFGNMARWAVLLIGATMILSMLGVETTSLAAVLAALGFAVGMALSGSLGNAASGIMLLVFRPFKVGDVVCCAGVTGKVTEIQLFVTAFDTPDNRRIVVPNNAIFGSTIENINHHQTRRVDVQVGAAYDADIDQTREAIMKAAGDVPGVLTDPAPVAVLGTLGDSCVNWTLRLWCNSADYWGVLEQGTRAVKLRLDEADIGIPFPQMDVHLTKEG